VPISPNNIKTETQ